MTVSRDDGPAKSSNDGENAIPPAEVPDYRALGLRDGIDGLRDLMNELLGEHGCPWDKSQTLESLRPYLLEEAYEVLESMDDAEAHRVELGDLLFQIVFQTALRERDGAFDFESVVEAIRSKMIRRHPHVFGAGRGQSLDSAAVSKQWEAIKQAERSKQKTDTIPNPLAGVPKGLPALSRAWRLQNRAAAVGFDWPSIDGVVEKWDEEWAEFNAARASGDHDAIEDELGDLLFVLVRLGQKLNINAEDALRRANAKFERRFAHVMARCHEAGLEPGEATLEQLENYWQDAKARLDKSNNKSND